jgi:HEPN domain-containing protein
MKKNLKKSQLENLLKYMKENKTILQPYFEEGASCPISPEFNPFSLADTYIIAADLIVNTSPDADVADIIAMPVAYLYRHATELYLKQTLKQLNVDSSKGHDINALYQTLQSTLGKIEKDKGVDTLLPDKETFKSIYEFFSISPKSTELRYSDSELLSSKVPLFLNFKNAQYHAENVQKYFKRLKNELMNLGFKNEI